MCPICGAEMTVVETSRGNRCICPACLHGEPQQTAFRLTRAQPDAAPLHTDSEQERDAAQVSSDC